ncbi:hypothetical protein MW887_000447 [Aspergillus wentii]|nr:hypothetical protein MW887_000447 [Aspergillus wentii]
MSEEMEKKTEEVPGQFAHGLPLFLQGFGVGLCLFLPCVSASIISTSLVTITSDLHQFSQNSWVITSYLIGYTGFLMIWSKCGDVLGVKSSFLSALTIFVAFAVGCGSAQTMNELIICRAFQGIGASGVNTLAFFTFIRLVPASKYGNVTTAAATVMSLGWILGPLLGGAICVSGAWRWTFLFNAPAGIIAWLIVYFMIPNNFPHHCDPVEGKEQESFWDAQMTLLRRVDWLGAFLMLVGSLLITAALAEADVRFKWSSGLVISFMTISVIAFIAFMVWEWAISRRAWKVEPMLPWRFLYNRVWMGVLSGFLLVGPSMTILAIELPQRFQTVNASSPLGAGVKLLAYAAAQPVGSLLSSLSSSRLQIPFIYILLVAAILQTVGSFLLSSLPTTVDFWTGQLGYMVIAGLGVGASTTTLAVMIPLTVEKADQQIAIGIALQLRMLGGVLGIAITNSVLNAYTKSHLPRLIPAADLSALHDSAKALDYFPLATQAAVRAVYGAAFNKQMQVVGGFSAAQLVFTLIMWQKQPLHMIKK